MIPASVQMLPAAQYRPQLSIPSNKYYSQVFVTGQCQTHSPTSSPIIINSATLPQSHSTGQSTCYSCLNSAPLIANRFYAKIAVSHLVQRPLRYRYGIVNKFQHTFILVRFRANRQSNQLLFKTII